MALTDAELIKVLGVVRCTEGDLLLDLLSKLAYCGKLVVAV
jgi:hypothetical protein